MDIRKVKKLIELLEESGIAEIEIKEGEESVRISRQSTYAPPMMQAPAYNYGAPVAAPAAEAPALEKPTTRNRKPLSPGMLSNHPWSVRSIARPHRVPSRLLISGSRSMSVIPCVLLKP